MKRFLTASLALVILFYKELKLFSFDPDFAGTVGFSRRGLEVLTALLTMAGVMISLRAIGVVLTTALLIVPAAAARQWTGGLGRMIFLAMAFGVVSGLGGAIWSQNADATPAGPAVTLTATSILIVSLALAPRRGMLWAWLRLAAHRRKVRRENLLSDFYRLGEGGKDWDRSRSSEDLAAVRGQPSRAARRTLRLLQTAGKVQRNTDGWRLTPEGLEDAALVVRNHRLWELYLTHRLDLPADHVHRDAEEMEHALSPEMVRDLENLLGDVTRDPHGRVVPGHAGMPGGKERAGS
jgi:manganese/zinc/iron transport system permease protein